MKKKSCIISENIDQSVDVFCSISRTNQTFYPKFNLKRSSQLLSQFNIEFIKKYEQNSDFSLNGISFLGTVQEYLFWEFFFYFDAHKEALKYIEGFDNYTFKTPKFYQINGIRRVFKTLYFYPSKPKSFVKNILIQIHNSFVSLEEFLFLDDGINSFRYKKIKEVLEKKFKITYIHPFYFSFRKLLTKKKFWLTGKNDLSFNKVPSHLQLNFSEEIIYDLIESKLRHICRSYKLDYKSLQNRLSHSKLASFSFGYDNIKDYGGILAALKASNIDYYAYQHGHMSKYQSGWIGFGLDKSIKNYTPDTLLCMGKYSADVLKQHSNIYSSDQLKIATHRNEDLIAKELVEKMPDSDKKTILYPYEFLAPTFEITKYLNHLSDLGFNILIKLRPNSSGHEKKAFNLTSPEKVLFINNDKDIKYEEVLCALASQTTITLEYMQIGIPCIILDEPFNYLEELIEQELSIKLNLETLKELKSIKDFHLFLEREKKKLKAFDQSYFYNSDKLVDIFNNLFKV